MAQYVIYTTEGYCESPDNTLVENCQVLGIEQAPSPEEAVRMMESQFHWKELGFKSVIVVEVIGLSKEIEL